MMKSLHHWGKSKFSLNSVTEGLHHQIYKLWALWTCRVLVNWQKF